MKANNLKILENKINEGKYLKEKIDYYEKCITKKINYIKKNEKVFGINAKEVQLNSIKK